MNVHNMTEKELQREIDALEKEIESGDATIGMAYQLNEARQAIAYIQKIKHGRFDKRR